MKQTIHNYGRRIACRQTALFVLAVIFSATHSFAQIYYSNFPAPAGKYSTVSPSGGICLAPSITDDGRIADADLTNYASVAAIISLSTPLSCNNNIYTIRTRINFPPGITQAPAGYFAGFRMQLNTVLDLTILQGGMTMHTYQGGVVKETAEGVTSLLNLNLLSLGNAPVNVFFPTTEPFDEVEMSFDASIIPVGLLYDYHYFYAFASATTLPVKLTAFNAATQSKNVTLNWSTTTETGTSRFDVERSTANGEFVKVGEVRAQNTHAQSDYTFTDRTALEGTSYTYRLKMVDLDGTFSYSKVILADRLMTESFKIYPTLVKQGQMINVLSNDIGMGEAALVDATGKLIRTYKLSGRLTIPTDDLKHGIYILKVTGEKKNSVLQKILVE